MKAHTLAQAMQEALTRSKRHTSGREYVHLRDGSPEWMTDVCKYAHGDMMPDDTRYFMIETAIYALSEMEPDEDPGDAIAALPSALDGAYSDVAQWLSSYAGYRLEYADDAAEEWGEGEVVSTFHRLARGMDYEQVEVFDLVVQALESVDDDAT